MITVVLSWIYIFIICFLLGVGVFSLGTKLCGKKDFTASVSLLTVLGVMVSTVIASYISCVAGIGMPAHLFLVLLAVLSPRPPTIAFTSPVDWSMTVKEACGCKV